MFDRALQLTDKVSEKRRQMHKVVCFFKLGSAVPDVATQSKILLHTGTSTARTWNLFQSKLLPYMETGPGRSGWGGSLPSKDIVVLQPCVSLEQ